VELFEDVKPVGALFETSERLPGFSDAMRCSVFECDLAPRQLARMEKAVRALMKPKEDNVRYYQLCRSCAQRAEVFGGRPLTERKEVYVV
jgi:CRISPR-associated endonuclease Cas2